MILVVFFIFIEMFDGEFVVVCFCVIVIVIFLIVFFVLEWLVER